MARPLGVIRFLVACMPAVMALVFVRAGIDVFTTPKATVAVIGAILVVALGLVRRSAPKPGAGALSLATGRTDTAYVVMCVTVVALFVTAALAAPSPLRALVGDAGRHSGVAVWTTAVVLSIAAMVAARLDGGDAVVSATVAASVPISLYALVQAAGRDPLTWSVIEGGPQVFATLGNADYLSAWLAMVIPLAVAVALGDTWSVTWRLLGVITSMLGFAAAVASGSLQGPIGGVAGTAFVIAAWVTEDGWAARTRRRAALGTAALVGVVLAAAVVGSPAGQASVLSSASRSLETRTPIWTAAWRMAAAEPLVGVGPGHFSDAWFAMRPDEAVPRASDGRTSDAPADAPLTELISADVLPTAVASRGAGERPVDDAHAIWLHLAATAGWPAAVLWTAIVILSVLRAVRTLEERSCVSRIRLAGLLGAVMAAVIVQSVSVDTPSVTVTAWVLVGALNGASSPNWTSGIRRAVRFADHTPPQGSPGQTWTQPPSPVTTPARGPFNVVVAVVTIAGVFAAAVPMGADLVAGSAGATPANANDSGDHGDPWERRLRLASAAAPWERRYPAMLAARYAEAGRFEDALEAQRKALTRAPRNRAAALDTARLTAVVEGAEAAIGAYASVLAIDDRTPDVLMEAGVNALLGGRPETAVVLIERAVAGAPGKQGWTSLLREARAAATISTGA